MVKIPEMATDLIRLFVDNIIYVGIIGLVIIFVGIVTCAISG